jgi:hypothetical protein
VTTKVIPRLITKQIIIDSKDSELPSTGIFVNERQAIQFGNDSISFPSARLSGDVAIEGENPVLTISASSTTGIDTARLNVSTKIDNPALAPGINDHSFTVNAGDFSINANLIGSVDTAFTMQGSGSSLGGLVFRMIDRTVPGSYASGVKTQNGETFNISNNKLNSDDGGKVFFSVGTGTLMTLVGRGQRRVGIGTESPSFQLQLSSDSAAKPSTNTWTISSDERVKTNIQNYTKGLEVIEQIRPVTYEYNGKGGFSELTGSGGIGIIAQEVSGVLPEVINSYFAKLEEDDEEETELLNYNGHAMTFVLINAVKELSQKVKNLESSLSGS